MKLNKIIIAPDSFKGCLNASDVADAIAEGINEAKVDVKIVKMPLSDGGEGFAALMAKCLNGKEVIYKTKDLLGRDIDAHYYMSEDGNNAFIESASTCGLAHLKKEERNPLETSSYSLGELIGDAQRKGCKKIYVGLGGTAVNDGGMGMLRVLGFRFFDKQGKELIGKGADLGAVCRISGGSIIKDDVEIIVVCDVNNPLTGHKGATFVYAPQKGADEKTVGILENGMLNYSKICASFLGNDYSRRPGAGAAGGIGFALQSFLGATMEKGIELILNTYDFDVELQDTDLIITGEGMVDSQSMMGKVLSGILSHAKPLNVPVVAIGGKVSDVHLLKDAGVKEIYCINSMAEGISSEHDAEKAKKYIKLTMNRLISEIGNNHF